MYTTSQDAKTDTISWSQRFTHSSPEHRLYAFFFLAEIGYSRKEGGGLYTHSDLIGRRRGGSMPWGNTSPCVFVPWSVLSMSTSHSNLFFILSHHQIIKTRATSPSLHSPLQTDLAFFTPMPTAGWRVVGGNPKSNSNCNLVRFKYN